MLLFRHVLRSAAVLAAPKTGDSCAEMRAPRIAAGVLRRRRGSTVPAEGSAGCRPGFSGPVSPRAPLFYFRICESGIGSSVTWLACLPRSSQPGRRGPILQRHWRSRGPPKLPSVARLPSPVPPLPLCPSAPRAALGNSAPYRKTPEPLAAHSRGSPEQLPPHLPAELPCPSSGKTGNFHAPRPHTSHQATFFCPPPAPLGASTFLPGLPSLRLFHSLRLIATPRNPPPITARTPNPPAPAAAAAQPRRTARIRRT